MTKLLVSPARLVAALLISASLALGVGMPARFASADANNVKNVQQNQIEAPGTADGSGASGAAVALTQAIVHQINVQVAAGDPQAVANSSQTATNTADVTQTSAAATGNTSGNGGAATSGTAIAKSTAKVLQMNIQVMALVASECVVDQVATNSATLNQTSLAGTGDATANGGGSTAQSGNATARNRAMVIQRNIQVYVCTGRGDLSEAAQQQADNAFAAQQTSIALSGAANASGGSSAASGSTDAQLRDDARQTNRQIVVN